MSRAIDPRPIDPCDVAVVVQGAVLSTTPTLLADIRRHLPGSQLILSTWEGSRFDGPDPDALVLSPDPGAMRCEILAGGRGPDINCNRMIRSTAAGLQAADRPYVVKVRTDCSIEHSGVLGAIAELPRACGEWQLFERAVGVSSVYTRHPAKSPHGLFHPADTVQFGLLADLRVLWDVPFMSEDDVRWFLEDRPGVAVADTSPRFYNEQHVFLSALRTRYVVDVESRLDRSPALVEASNRALAQNFVVVEPWASGIRLPRLERHLRWHEDPTFVMITPMWQQLHRSATSVRREHPWPQQPRPDCEESQHG